ncbi:MAG: ABC transporter permease subunit [Methylobacterium frigidaeris]
MTSLTAPALGATPAEAGLPRATGRVDRPLQALTYATVAVLVLAPIVPILIQSFSSKPLYDDTGIWTLADYAELAQDPAFWRASANTLLFGAASTLIAQVVGVWLAIVIGRTDLPGRRVLGAVATWPLFVSHLVLAFGWIIAYGPAGYVTSWLTGLIGEEPWNLYTLGGLSLAAGLSMAPLTYLYCVGAARTIDGSLENAARLAGAGPFRTLVTVTLPLLRPAIIASTILNFVLAIELLVLPLLLGAPSGLEFLTTFIYTRGFEDSTPRHGMVAAVAVILFAVVTLLVLAQMRLVGDGRRFTTVGGKAARPRRLELSWAKWPTFGLVLAFDAFFVVAILGGLVLRGFTSVLSPFVPLSEALTLDNFRTIFAYEQYVRSIGNTIAVAVAGGVIGTALVAAAALVALRSDVPGPAGAGLPGGLSAGGAGHPHRHGLPVGGDVAAGPEPAPEHDLDPGAGLRDAPPADRLGRGAAGPAPDHPRPRPLGAHRRVELDPDGDRDPAAADAPGPRRLLHPALRPLREGIRRRGVPVRAGQRGDGHHDADLLGPGRERRGGGAGHAPGRHRGGVHGPAVAAAGSAHP